MNKLVTFGDSFVVQRTFFLPEESKSWLDYVCRENKFRLDGYGDGGTGPYNAILNFLEYEEDFDICFCALYTIKMRVTSNEPCVDRPHIIGHYLLLVTEKRMTNHKNGTQEFP